MDVALSMVAGLSLRAFLISLNARLGRSIPAILGLWEGAVLHQLSSRSSSEVDHYLAYGLRIAIDLLISRNNSKMIMVLLWTTLGAVVSESIVPRSRLRRTVKRERRHKSSRSLPSHIRVYQHPVTPEPPQPQSSAHPELPFLPPKHEVSTPQFPTNRPPSPPSFFLHEGSESLSPSPIPIQVHPLLLSPTRPPTALANYLERGDELDSPSPKPVLLPTPPQSAPSDGVEYLNSRETSSPHRLSTIHEISSGEDLTPPNADPETQNAVENGDNIDKILVQVSSSGKGSGDVQSYPPSPGGDLPIPVPNATIRTSPRPNRSEPNSNGDNPYSKQRESSHSPILSILPIPVPNMTIWNWRSDVAIVNEPDGEPRTPIQRSPSDSDVNDGKADFDELMTPVENRISDVVHEPDHDPLRTPITLRPQEVLSPLLLDEPLATGTPRAADHASALEAAVMATTSDHPAGSLNRSVNRLANFSNSTLLQPPTLPGTLPLDNPPGSPTYSNDPAVLSDPETLHTPSDTTSVLSTRSPKLLTRKAEQFRQDAREAEQEHSKLKLEYATALKESRIKDALMLKGKMWDAEEKIKSLHKRAAKRYYVSLNDYNPKKRPNTIDVHGLRPGEAIERTEKAFREALNAGHSTLRVIVGKGLHSVNGKAILKHVIIQAMNSQKIPCRVDTWNAGVLILTLPP